MTVKRLAAYSLVAFSVTLGIIVGNRMSSEAMAVVIGVVCGVAASIPMSGLILLMSRRSRPVVEEDGGPQRSRPPIVLVAPATFAQQAPAWSPYGQTYAAPAAPAPREYRIIGEE